MIGMAFFRVALLLQFVEGSVWGNSLDVLPIAGEVRFPSLDSNATKRYAPKKEVVKFSWE